MDHGLKTQLIVCGATGRMGSLICQLAQNSKNFKLSGRADSKHPLKNVIETGDVIIDFSLPEATEENVHLATQHKKPIVIGTTGLNEKQKSSLMKAAQNIPVVYSPNMSIGVNVLFKLIDLASQTLGKEYTTEISETHHIHKKDKPSGTAKVMAEMVAQNTGSKPPIESNREGEVVGDHTIVFGSSFEHLAIMHRAIDRKVFADGALKAAHWILGKKSGLYTMAHVLGLV